MPRFVLLRHECPPSRGPSHWDFMLERDGELLTWRLLEWPSAWLASPPPSKGGARGGISNAVEHRDATAQSRTDASSASETPPTKKRVVFATRLANHRLAYLDYEGPISGDRGEVRRIDAGDYDLLSETPDYLRIVLHGAHGVSEVTLTQIRSDEWRLEAVVARR